MSKFRKKMFSGRPSMKKFSLQQIENEQFFEAGLGKDYL